MHRKRGESGFVGCQRLRDAPSNGPPAEEQSERRAKPGLTKFSAGVCDGISLSSSLQGQSSRESPKIWG